jgi:hypothetical protein
MAQPDINSSQIETGSGDGSFVLLESYGSPAITGLPATDGSQLTGLSTDPTDGNVATPTVRLDDGTAGLPSYSFTSDPDTGFYSTASGSVGYSANTNLVLTLVPGGITMENGTSIQADLTTSTPAYTFNGDTDTGMGAHSNLNQLEFYVGGTNVLECRATYTLPKVQTRHIDGTAGAPSYSFTTNQTSGMYKDAGGNIAFSVASQESLNIESDGTLNVAAVANYETLVTLDDDIPNKKYVDDIAGGVPVTGGSMTGDLTMTGAGSPFNVSQIFGDVLGDNTAPAFAFDTDGDTGMYRQGTNAIGFATTATERLVIESNGTLNVAGTTNYEDLVTSDDDVPNKKYVDDAIKEIPIVTDATATHTLVLTDAGKLISMTSGSANTLQIPANASVAFPTGTQILIEQEGAGQTTVAITTDTLHSASSNVKLTSQYSTATIIKKSATVWLLAGDLSA